MADFKSVDSSAESEGDLEDSREPITVRRDKAKPGIVYLSKVPSGFNVSQTTSFFAEFGRVGRVFLQPDKHDRKLGKFNKDRVFTEGWVEFKSKKVAKSVAANLNCNPVGGKRRSKAHDELWNIKYLPRFKWVHLSERLAYESAVKQQRMRTEVSQVKREAEHFKSSVEKKRRKSKGDNVSAGDSKEENAITFNQRETDAQIKKRKIDANITSVKHLEEGETKNKKAKKNDHEKVVLKVKSKSKKDKSLKAKSLKAKKEGDRTQFFQSVFGGSS